MSEAQKRYQHAPLRIPVGWKGQEASLVMQLERLFDEVYTELGKLRERVKDLEDRVAELEEE